MHIERAVEQVKFSTAQRLPAIDVFAGVTVSPGVAAMVVRRVEVVIA